MAVRSQGSCGSLILIMYMYMYVNFIYEFDQPSSLDSKATVLAL